MTTRLSKLPVPQPTLAATIARLNKLIAELANANLSGSGGGGGTGGSQAFAFFQG